MKKFKKTNFFVTALLVVTLFLTACGGSKTSNERKEIDLSSYPIKTDVTLSWFMPLRSESAGMIENYSETAYAQEYENRVGVHIDYMHPAIGQQTEMLSLLIASNELPDIIQNNWTVYQGGVTGAINDKVIVPLNDYKEYAPAYFKLVEETPTLEKFVKNDDGYYSGFECVQPYQEVRNIQGPAIRRDILNELGLEIPTTIDEWENVLLTIKKEKNVLAPLAAADFSMAYTLFGVHYGLYINDEGKYDFGWAQPGLKEALVRLNDWYKKGLIDKNFITADAKSVDTQILTGQTIATFISGGDIGRYMNAAEIPGFDLVGIPFPKLDDGSYNPCMLVGQIASGNAASISAQCKYPELAAKVIDYNYTDEGHIFANFGKEGEAHTVVDGEHKYTDLVVNNPDGLSVMESLAFNTRAGAVGPFAVNKGYLLQYYKTPQQKEALSNWQVGFDTSNAHRQLPVSLTPEEAQEASDITTELYKYSGTMCARFISGQESFDNFDAYMKHMEALGLSRLCEIYTNALNRFNAR